MTVSVHFLLRFVVASSLLMGLWLGWGVDYLDLVAPAVNSLTVWLDVPFQLIRDGDAVLYAYHPPVGRSFRLLATGQESIYLNLVALGAVFAATPGRSTSWRLGWGTGAFGLLWMTHVVSFYMGGSVALWQFAEGGSLSLVHPLASWIPASRGDLYLQILTHWNLWGRYSICVLMWIVACAHPLPAPSTVIARQPSTLRHWTLRPTTS